MVLISGFLLGCTLITLLLVRIPIALAMLLSSMAFLLFTTSIPMTIVPQRLWSGLESFPLLAIPYFVLAGILINESGGAERIFTFCLSVVGHFRGGLGHVNVLGSMIFAGMSGSATADAAGLSRIEIDAMAVLATSRSSRLQSARPQRPSGRSFRPASRWSSMV